MTFKPIYSFSNTAPATARATACLPWPYEQYLSLPSPIFSIHKLTNYTNFEGRRRYGQGMCFLSVCHWWLLFLFRLSLAAFISFLFIIDNVCFPLFLSVPQFTVSVRQLHFDAPAAPADTRLPPRHLALCRSDARRAAIGHGCIGSSVRLRLANHLHVWQLCIASHR